jgi:hypothetical protein
MHAVKRVVMVAGILALALTFVGCGGEGGGVGGPPPGGTAGTPLVSGQFTATPTAGEELQDLVVANGGPEGACVVVWGGQIADFRIGKYGAALGQVVYSSGAAGNHDIKVVNVDTGLSQTIVTTQYDDVAPTWVDDGRQVAFEMVIGSDKEIYLASPTGRGIQNLTGSGQGPNNNEMQPAGGYGHDSILFTANQDGDNDIYRMDIDGGPWQKLTTNATPDGDPAWAPEGGRIIYSSKQTGNWDLRIIQPGGGNYPITATTTPEVEPSWSPDATQIAYARRVAGNWDIYTCNVDGSNVDRLTNHAADDLHPSWSDDGRRIVFWSKRTGNGDIYVMNANGTAETRVTTDTTEDMHPEWNEATRQSRTFVGPAGSDGGFDPPFGSNPLDLVVAGGDDYGARVFGMRCMGAASAVQVKNLNETGYPLPFGVSIHTPDTILLLGEDTGRGKPIVRHIRNTGTNATFVGDFDNVILVFDGDNGNLEVLAPWRGAPKTMLPLDTSAMADEPTIEMAGSEIIVRGPRLGAPGGGLCQELVFRAGEIVSFK